MFCKMQTAKSLENCLNLEVNDSTFRHDSGMEVYFFLYDENPCNVLVKAKRFDIFASGYKRTLEN